MTLRRDRTHTTGISNIDFRTKGDIESLELFQPWMTHNGKTFGTMGNSNYMRSYSAAKRVFGVTDKINTQRNLALDTPDPRYYTTAQFYKKNKINLNQRNIFTNERVAQLDENFKGKDHFVGDSMMIVDIKKKRSIKSAKYPRTLDEINDYENKKKAYLQNKIIKDKSNKNKEAIQETQLVKLEVEETLEGKVDIAKLKEIRLVLRRRYANRKNFQKIFKEWDISNHGEITPDDANVMINNLQIPINYNETRALIASANERGTETLNLEEFMQLIFNDNPTLNVDLKKMKYVKEHSGGMSGHDVGLNEEQQAHLKQSMRDNIREMSKTEELNGLKDYIRARFPKFIRFVNEEGVTGGLCDYSTFERVIGRFQMVSKYQKEPLLKAFFDIYKNKDDDLLDCKKLSENLVEKQAGEFFSIVKDHILDTHKNQIEKDEDQLAIKVSRNKSGFAYRKSKRIELDEQIREKRRIESAINVPSKREKEVNSTVPSTKFVHKVFDKRQEYFNKLNEVEMKFGTTPNLVKPTLKPQTRFSARPRPGKMGEILCPMVTSPTYISERDRFNRNTQTTIASEDKRKKLRTRENNIRKTKLLIDSAQQDFYWKSYMIDEKRDNSLLHRSKMKYDYEKKVMLHNKIIE